jgi:hypothetical protein
MTFVNGSGRTWSRAPTRALNPQSGHRFRTGEDAGFDRRSPRLLCGDWPRRDDSASGGYVALAADDFRIGAALINSYARHFGEVRDACALDREIANAQIPPPSALAPARRLRASTRI